MKPQSFQRFITALLIAAAALVAGLPARAAEREELIPGRPEITTRALVVTPDRTPRAGAILYIGGNGNLSGAKNNFVMRIRQKLADAGLLLVIPDAPSDRVGKTDLQGNFRASAQHAADAQGLVQFIKKQAAGGDLPVFAIGTSRGSTSAANAAGRLGPDLIAGVALTSSVTRKGDRGQISVYETPVDKIVQPALVMWHLHDACNETPPADAGKLAQSLTASAKVTVKTLDGGAPPKSAACNALSAHGYYGIEDQAAEAILAWIDETLVGLRH
jgi:dienelactone hydrolase